MSYHIYTTKGLILSTRPMREADRVYSVLTEDFGLLSATAIGVRKIVSKLRGSMEPYSFARVSLVRGKEYWRITSAELVEALYPRAEIVRPVALLEKLVAGEDAHPELYEIVERNLLGRKEYPEEFEVRFVGELLVALGYLKESDLSLGEKELVRAINQGLKESGLVSE